MALLRIKLNWLLIASALIFSCKKEIQTLSCSTINVGRNTRLNDAIVINDTTWVVCGGMRDAEGWILSTDNGGQSWHYYKTDFPKSVYTVSQKPGGELWAGGDFLNLWKSADNGTTWNFHWLADQVPYHGEDRPSVRKMLWTSDSTGYFVGGENLGEGVIYYTSDGGVNWQFSTQQYELRAIDFLDDNSGMVAGHGAIFSTSQGFGSFGQLVFENEFVTALIYLDQTSVIAAGYNGGIFKSFDSGLTWQEVFDSNKIFRERINWHDMVQHRGKLVVCGNYGMLAVSEDEGESWKCFRLKEESHLFSCTSLGDTLLFTSEAGNLLKCSMP